MKSPGVWGTTLLLKGEEIRKQVKGGILVKEEEWPEDYRRDRAWRDWQD